MRLAATIALVALAVPAAADTVSDILSRAEAACTSFEDGAFDPGDGVSAIDLDGDGDEDTLVDEGRFACSTAASMYCGTGGCMLHAVIDDHAWSFQAEAWRMIEWHDRPILLVARDGVWCGGLGAQLCYEAVVWSQGDMLTVMPPQ